MQIAACSASMVKCMKKNKQFERAVHGLFLILGLVTVASVLVITVYLVISGIPAILEIGLWDFLFGDTWDPASAEPKFGILPFILPTYLPLPLRPHRENSCNYRLPNYISLVPHWS